MRSARADECVPISGTSRSASVAFGSMVATCFFLLANWSASFCRLWCSAFHAATFSACTASRRASSAFSFSALHAAAFCS